MGFVTVPTRKKERKLTMNEMLGKIVKLIVIALSADMYGTLFDLLEKLTSSNAEIWKEEIKKFLRKEKCWDSFESYVRKELSVLDISATDVGNDLTLKQYFLLNFFEFGLKHKYGSLRSEPRPASQVEFILSFAGSFRELFPLGGQRKSLDDYCLTPDQVVDVFDKHYEHLFQEGDSTKYLFLIKQEDEYAVLCVCQNNHLPACIVYSINNSTIFNSGYMMVATPVLMTH